MQTGTLTPADSYLNRKYGHRAATVQPYITADPDWLDDEHSLTVGEVRYFIEEEMAQHLSDVVFRRTALGTAQCPPTGVLQDINQIMAKHFSWSEQRQFTELTQVLQRYAPLKSAQIYSLKPRK